ncbi:hypothetical protein [Nocardioides sp.]|uniref:hypothetical protein n=1 Tax=Nocardioides sp. TaxID=35761 RepID=UPI0039E46A66
MSDPVAAWLSRAADTCRQLAGQRREMDAYTVGGRGGHDITGRRGTKVWPDLPINVGPIDLMDEIDSTVRRYADLTRGTLRLGFGNGPGDTSTNLSIIADNLTSLNDEDPTLTAEVVEAVWTMHRRASRIVDPPRGRVPFRIVDTCPECGFESLWFDPNQWLIACGMPHCRHVWGPAEKVLRTSA